MWMSGPVYVLFIFCLPETSNSTILLHRARRLRKATGNTNIRSQSEIDQKDLTVRAVSENAFIKPFEIMIKDPAIPFENVYTAFTYATYYSFLKYFRSSTVLFTDST
jgi:DHA1 family multidrug resistance protein-like MFS transporter